ncbi:prenyltransferase/squalene oxidase repeat-containing protein, partial [Eubacterium sp.]|uniref:prenyltransferase/squalene oxidase repeat-containing protein n=1 Tax=Eubacterium sp. TaxID=142586 RepID=UPI0025CE12DF
SNSKNINKDNSNDNNVKENTSEKNIKDRNNKNKPKKENNNSDKNDDYIIGIASNEAKSITELIDEEHIKKIDDEIEEYKNRIEEVAYKDVALQMQWEMISLLSSGKEMDRNYLNGYREEFINSIDAIKGVISSKGTDYSKAVITMSTLGINHNDDKYNITNHLTNQEEISAQGLNGPIWALIALSSSDEIKDQYEKERTDYYNLLANEWKNKGCFSLMGDKGDVDLTAMAILAGSLYSKDKNCDKEFLKEAVKFLEEQSDENGEYKSMDSINSESLSYATMAMLSVKDKDYDFNRAIDKILSYKTKDGLYAHLYEDKNKENGNEIATQQAILAFCMISNAYYTDEDKLFYYGDNNKTNVNFLNANNIGSDEQKNETTAKIKTNDNDKKKNKNKDNGIWVKIVFIGIFVICSLCACLYYLLRALRKKKESK